MTEKLLTPNQLAENLGVKPFTLLDIDGYKKLFKALDDGIEDSLTYLFGIKKGKDQ